MRQIAVLFSAIGLALTVVPALLVALGLLDWDSHARLMFWGMLIWFVSAPLWMKSGS